MPSTHEPPRRRIALRVLPAVAWSLVVAVLLLAPGESLPQPGLWAWLDKPVHAVLFAVHCLALAPALGVGGSRRPLRGAILGSGLYALVCELAQLGIAGRSFTGWDLAAGWFGIAAAAAFLARPRDNLRRSSRA